MLSLKNVGFNIIKTCSLFAIAGEENVLIAYRQVFDLSHLKLKSLTVTIFLFLGRCMSWLSFLSLKLRCQSSYGVTKGLEAACPYQISDKESAKLVFDFYECCTFSGVHFCHCSWG